MDNTTQNQQGRSTSRDDLMKIGLTAACRVARPELEDDDMGPGSLGYTMSRPIEAAITAVLDEIEQNAEDQPLPDAGN